MSAILKEMGFQVIGRENATKQQMERAVAEFGQALAPGAVALFYYAGHGIQVSGRNFLVPVDAQIDAEHTVRLETLDVDLVLDQVVAKGLAQVDPEDMNGGHIGKKRYYSKGVPAWNEFANDASQVVAAMRQPAAAMIGPRLISYREADGKVPVTWLAEEDELSAAWQSMIDVALAK